MGLFEWTLMPFDIKNAPACFQRITDFISNQINSSHIEIKRKSKENKAAQMKAYLDDLTAGANTFMGMMQLMEKLFSLCRELKLKLHPDKSFLFLRNIRILGHMLTTEGIHPMDKILRRMSSSRRPENKDQVRAFKDYLVIITSLYQRSMRMPILFRTCCLKKLRFRGKSKKVFCLLTKLALGRQLLDASR